MHTAPVFLGRLGIHQAAVSIHCTPPACNCLGLHVTALRLVSASVVLRRRRPKAATTVPRHHFSVPQLLGKDNDAGGDVGHGLLHFYRAIAFDSTFVVAALYAASAHQIFGQLATADSIARSAGSENDLRSSNATSWTTSGLTCDGTTPKHVGRLGRPFSSPRHQWKLPFALGPLRCGRTTRVKQCQSWKRWIQTRSSSESFGPKRVSGLLAIPDSGLSHAWRLRGRAGSGAARTATGSRPRGPAPC